MTVLTTAFRHRNILGRTLVAVLVMGLVALLAFKIWFSHPRHALPASSDLPFRAGSAGETEQPANDLFSPVPHPMEGRSLHCHQAARGCLKRIFSAERPS